ncbi:MAG: hypothetical protein U0Z53_30385 [Blastocatellia bacterium]
MNIVTRHLCASIMLLMLLASAQAQTRTQNQPVFTSLDRVEQLREQFEKDKGRVRIVTLLSPT